MEAKTKPKVPSFEEIKKERPPIKNATKVYKENLSLTDRIALWVTERIGSVGFFCFIFIFNALWMAWNALAPKNLVFDPAWTFLILLFVNNILQILFLPLIMVGQNLEGRHAEWRAQTDFEVNLKAEREINAVFMHLEYQNQLLEEILDTLKAKLV